MAIWSLEICSEERVLTLCPFIPGSPGVPGKPRAPWGAQEEEECEYKHVNKNRLISKICYEYKILTKSKRTKDGI